MPLCIDVQKSLKNINSENWGTVKMFCRSVIVIEDEAILRKLYKEHLSRLNHFVEIFPTAEEALAVFKKDPTRYDIVLTDNLLEGGEINGSDLAKKIKSINSKIKVFIVTGDMQSVDCDIFDHNIEGTLNKPVDSFTFINTVGNGKRIIQQTEKIGSSVVNIDEFKTSKAA
jgi:DNA-binding NtrC family response regulator